VRHLNHKFPKLFQLASVQLGVETRSAETQAPPLVKNSGGGLTFLIAQVEASGLRFVPSRDSGSKRDAVAVFPHNPADLSWMQCLLNSPPAQFWIRHSGNAKGPRQIPKGERFSARELYQELRSVPIVDLTRAPTDAVHEALEWLGRASQDITELQRWAGEENATLIERQARYVAMSRKYCGLEQLLERYRPMVDGDLEGHQSNRLDGDSTIPITIRPDAVTRFYPERMLCHVAQSPDVRIQYTGRERTSLIPENWTVAEAHVVAGAAGATISKNGFVVVGTRQGPSIQILTPAPILGYVAAQFKELRDHTWGEALSMIRIPRDVGLFAAQTAEITRVLVQTRSEMTAYKRALDGLALGLFEISPELRQFLIP